MAEDEVLVAKYNRAGFLTLNRPGALNALSGEMLGAMWEALDEWRKDIDVYAVVLDSSSPKVFCAGGDIRFVHQHARKDQERACAFLRREYSYNWRLSNFSKPHVALMNGLTLGGGVGVSFYGTHRVAGADFCVGMPETIIGFVPDVGASWFLGHMPGAIGLYLALTGRTINRADAYYLGLVTHCIDQRHFADVKQALSEAEPIDDLLDGLHEDPGEVELKRLRSWIEAVFSASTLEEIFSRAEGLGEQTRGWSTKVLEELRRKSPTSLHLSMQLWKRGRNLNLRRALQQEYGVICNLLRGDDFYEGVRAQLVDRDKAPKWRPASIGEVSQADIDACFSAPSHQLDLPEPETV